MNGEVFTVGYAETRNDMPLLYSTMALSRSMAHHTELQHAIAQMTIEIKGIGPHLDNIAQDWTE